MWTSVATTICIFMLLNFNGVNSQLTVYNPVQNCKNSYCQQIGGGVLVPGIGLVHPGNKPPPSGLHFSLELRFERFKLKLLPKNTNKTASLLDERNFSRMPKGRHKGRVNKEKFLICLDPFPPPKLGKKY